MPKKTEQHKKSVVKHVPEIKKSPIMSVRKRNGSVMPYDAEHIVSAVQKAMKSTGEGGLKEAEYIARKVESELKRIGKIVKDFVPTVEGIQDVVERELILEEYVKTAKSYILYREERARLRGTQGEVPEEVKKLVEEGNKYFRNPMSEF